MGYTQLSLFLSVLNVLYGHPELLQHVQQASGCFNSVGISTSTSCKSTRCEPTPWVGTVTWFDRSLPPPPVDAV